MKAWRRRPKVRSNGEVEGPDDHARQAPRAHTVFQRPRRQPTTHHGPLQRLLRVTLVSPAVTATPIPSMTTGGAIGACPYPGVGETKRAIGAADRSRCTSF